MAGDMISLDKNDLHFILDMIADRREEAERAVDYTDAELVQIIEHLDALQAKVAERLAMVE